MRWRPVPAVQLLMSANQDRAAPTGAQITDPPISTPNVSVFDYATGQTVFVTQLSGGNAALRESVRDQFRLSANIKDRKSVVEGKSVSVGVDLGGRRLIKK